MSELIVVAPVISLVKSKSIILDTHSLTLAFTSHCVLSGSQSQSITFAPFVSVSVALSLAFAQGRSIAGIEIQQHQNNLLQKAQDTNNLWSSKFNTQVTHQARALALNCEYR